VIERRAGACFGFQRVRHVLRLCLRGPGHAIVRVGGRGPARAVLRPPDSFAMPAPAVRRLQAPLGSPFAATCAHVFPQGQVSHAACRPGQHCPGTSRALLGAPVAWCSLRHRLFPPCSTP